jgi:hypothetical protein
VTLPPWTSAWWFVPVVALVAILGLVHAWNGERSARSKAEKSAEAAELRAKGVEVAAEVTAAGLRSRVATLEGESADLRAEVQRVKAAAPGAKVVGVVTGTTGHLAVITPEAPPAATGGAAPPSLQPAPGVLGDGGCLLHTGDSGEIKVSTVALETKAGNLVVVGAAEAWKAAPGPPARLFGGPLRLDVGREVPPASAGWGGGLGGWAGRTGWLAGPAVAPPPWKFWSHQVEVVGGAGFGPSGDWLVAATVVVR